MSVKVQSQTVNPAITKDKKEPLSTTLSVDEQEAVILEKLGAKNDDIDNVSENETTDAQPELIPIDTIIETVKSLFEGLSVIVHPCWKLQQNEAERLVYTLNAAYPEISIQSFAKIMFWVNVTMIFLPRTLITVRDFIGKRQNNEVGSDTGQTR